jgi:hypothetical protein
MMARHLDRVHWTLGILRTSQAFFYALAFFQLDGFSVPAPAQVTQAVSPLKTHVVGCFRTRMDFVDVSATSPLKRATPRDHSSVSNNRLHNQNHRRLKDYEPDCCWNGCLWHFAVGVWIAYVSKT